jgi:hypothetical protein
MPRPAAFVGANRRADLHGNLRLLVLEVGAVAILQPRRKRIGAVLVQAALLLVVDLALGLIQRGSGGIGGDLLPMKGLHGHRVVSGVQ